MVERQVTGSGFQVSEKEESREQETRTVGSREPSASEASPIAERRSAEQGHKILVTGAGGFIGRNLCPMLEREGFYVRRVVRRPIEVDAVEIQDINPDTDWSEALRGMHAVVHLAARVHVLREQADEPAERFRQVNVDATLRLARQAVAAGVKRFVFVSTIGVHGVKTEGQGFSEYDVPNPTNEYSRSKWQAEQALIQLAEETGLELVIIRPPLVYGPGVKANFLMLLNVVKCGLPLPLASISNKRDMVYVGNLSDAIRLCVIHPAAVGRKFVVSDGEPISTPDLIRRIARAIGKKPRLLPMPVRLLRMAGCLLGRSDMVHRLVSSLEVDSRKIRETLDWRSPYTFDDGLKATVEWYIARKS